MFMIFSNAFFLEMMILSKLDILNPFLDIYAHIAMKSMKSLQISQSRWFVVEYVPECPELSWEGLRRWQVLLVRTWKNDR